MDGNGKDIPLNITVRRPSAGGEISWTTSCFRDDSIQTINAISDKMMEGLERQGVWGRIEAINNEIAEKIGLKAATLYNVRRFELLPQEAVTPVDEQAYRQNRETLIRMDTLIELLEEKQRRLKQLLNGEHDGKA